MYRYLRNHVKAGIFRFLKRIGTTNDARSMAYNTLKGLFCCQPRPLVDIENVSPPVYPELGRAQLDRSSCLRKDIVIITARFRSGSTLLWNIFRNVGGCTAYFEPFHPLRPFDPLSRAQRVSASHKHVTDYWREYDGIQGLDAHFDDDWSCRQLFMNRDVWNPRMKRYIELLVESAPQRPVLQFNRIDFRLPWIRQHFPYAKIIHLYRHPRDQWCSLIRSIYNVPAASCLEQFKAHDYYFTQEWVEDLQYQFPFLDWHSVSHPYEIFYYIWKLSYLFGRNYSHYSFAFEELISSSDLCLREMFQNLNIREYKFEKIEALISKPRREVWKEYAEDAWFRQHEEKCETILEEFLYQLQNG